MSRWGNLDIANGGRIYKNISETGIEDIEFADFVTTGTAYPHIDLGDLNNDGLVDIIGTPTTGNLRVHESQMRWGDFVRTNEVSESDITDASFSSINA